MFSDPLGFLLTMRTYGTWLHGDERGSVDDEHNAYGTPYIAPDAHRLTWERAQMRAEPLILDGAMRGVVEAALEDQCRYRGWELMGRAARSNHVHAVVGFAGVAPEIMLKELKSRATRWLRQRGLVAREAPVWADGPGSRRYLWKPDDVAGAVTYVREWQDEPR